MLKRPTVVILKEKDELNYKKLIANNYDFIKYKSLYYDYIIESQFKNDLFLEEQLKILYDTLLNFFQTELKLRILIMRINLEELN